jgi:hypothetical protein
MWGALRSTFWGGKKVWGYSLGEVGVQRDSSQDADGRLEDMWKASVRPNMTDQNYSGLSLPGLLCCLEHAGHLGSF